MWKNMNKFYTAQKLVTKYANKIRNHNTISIVQIGSSLRKEDFTQDSDLDFLIIYKQPVKDFLKHDSIRHFEVNIIPHKKNQYIKSLKEGNPVDLIALKYGKILYDNGFFETQRNVCYKPTQKTIDKWFRTAAFNLGDASINYSLPACLDCYYKSLHHAAREFSRAIIVKKYGEIVEGSKEIIDKLKNKYPKICRNFEFVINGRRDCKDFGSKLIKVKYIGNSGLGKYLLATEEIAIEAFKICKNLKLPRINDLILSLAKKYQIKCLHSFHLIPESMQILINISLERDKVAVFCYDIRRKTIKRL